MNATEIMMSVMLISSLLSSVGAATLMILLSLAYPVAYMIFGFRLTRYSSLESEIEYQKASTYIKNHAWFQSYTSAGHDVPTGLVCGINFAAYIVSNKGEHGATKWEIWMWSRKIPETNIHDPNSNTKTLTTLYDDGSIYYNHWTNCEKNVPGSPQPFQTTIVEKIIDLMRTSEKNGYGNNITVLIYGPSGTGKSKISKFLALALGAKYCSEFSPLKPRSGHESLHATAVPTKDTPLVVALNEFDKIAEAAFKNPLIEVPKVPPLIYNKATYNNFMDGLSEFPNTAYILTTNYPPSWFDELEPAKSSIRDGRVNLLINISDHCNVPNIASLMQKERFEK
jgi:hypothetical protein